MIKITNNNAGELLIFDVTGKCTFQDISSTILDNYKIAKKYVLWDFGDSDLSELSNDEIFEVSLIVRDNASHEKTAYVGKSSLEFGLLNMYKAFTKISGIAPKPMVFKSKKKALVWLYDVEPDACQPQDKSLPNPELSF